MKKFISLLFMSLLLGACTSQPPSFNKDTDSITPVSGSEEFEEVPTVPYTEKESMPEFTD
ncbi:hypothetical protein [Avibacterium sp. 21-599]|uniref:hypothetical protein n=1 Tax=Avibacterium sp. 21-599 TaxID=2911528 RepID=UPI002245973C|nr:hypothetical protein [Avibacterium sp. 21-599]MCW9717828.1 hypothetical protein [Avibacterium sp. 21-599]